MKKRFGFLSLFAVTALLLAIVGAVAALAAPSAAGPVTGTIEFDEDWYTTGSEVEITVTDPDANTTVDQANTIRDANLIGGGNLSALAAFESVNFALTNTPVVGDVDLFFDRAGVKGDPIPAATLSITSLNRDNGFVTLQAGAGGYAGGDFQAEFAQAKVDVVSVTIVSDVDPDGLTLTATEVDAINDDDEFTVIFEVANTTTPGAVPPKLNAQNTNEMTATYSDITPTTGTLAKAVTAVANVETSEPTFSSLIPEDGFSTQTKAPNFSGIINDSGGAGIDVSEITITIVDTGSFAPDVTGSDGDDSVTYTFKPDTSLTENVVHAWNVSAADMAGNTGTSDANPDNNDPTEIQDNHTVNVDTENPSIDNAETGRYYDSVDEVEKSDKLDRLVVIFDDDVDGDTISAADFTVDGISPIDIDTVDAADNEDEDGNPLTGGRVYLTLSEDLAADAEPVVRIAAGGSVSDKAGNSLTSQGDDVSTDAVDKIAPTYTVTLDKTLTNDELAISVSSNERGSVPQIRVHNIDGSDKLLDTLVVSATSWEATFTESGASFEEENSVVVTGFDKNNVEGTEGDATINVDGDFEDDAIVFEQDTLDPDVTFDAAVTAGEVFSTAPFITLTFDGKVTVDLAEFGPADGDLVDVTADGRISGDQETWIYKASGLTVDEEYTINVTVTDLAGNEIENANVSFTVEEPEMEEVLLVPGSNLVSLSGSPADSDINAVITLAEVSSVVTYDPVNPDPVTGAWKTATRDSSGSLSGSLSTIDAQHAYWVSTTTFESIEVEVVQLGAGAAIPPSITLVAGWNLVPVVNVSGDAAGVDVDGVTDGIQLDADAYFGSTSWVTAYTWDTQAEQWVKVLPGTFKQVTVGKGYWVYVTEDGILVP